MPFIASLQIDVYMGINGITSLDIMRSKLASPGYLYISWVDEHLSWNRSAYNGLHRLMVEANEVWTPNIVQRNGMKIELSVAQAWLNDNGRMNFIISTTYEGDCLLDVRRYPLDVHECTLSISPYALDASEIQFRHLTNISSTNIVVDHGEWEIIDSRADVVSYEEIVSGATFVGYENTLILSRRYKYVMVHTILPYGTFTLLNLMIYLVPLRSGERITFSITVLLAFVFFTSDISDELPNNSMRLSYMSVGMAALIITTTFSVMISVILCRMDLETTVPIPRILESITSKWYKYIQKRESSKPPPSSSPIQDEISQNENCDEKQVSIDENEEISVEMTESITWSDVAKMVDHLLFYTNLILIGLVGLSGVALVAIN